MKHVQKPEKIHLDKLISEIEKGRYVIPDFQRPFTWEPWDVTDLLKSIFMDYYIGTLLLWEGNKQNYDVLNCQSIFGFEGSLDPSYIVLDGQQRLSALHYAMFQPEAAFPKRKSPCFYFIRINELLEQEYDKAFFYENETRKWRAVLNSTEEQYKLHLFPVGVMKGRSWEIEDWIKGYRNYWQDRYDQLTDDQHEEKEAVRKYVDNALSFKELMNDLLMNYNVSYIELDDNIEIGKVCDIFTHINSKGVSLDIFDLLNAILRPKELKLKEMWEDASLNLDFASAFKTKIYVLQVMSILAQSYCSSKYLYYLVPGAEKTIKKKDGSTEQTILVPDSDDFTKRWNEAVGTIEKTIKVLSSPNDLGAILPQYVPYPSIIPALSAIRRYVATSSLDNKVDVHNKIHKWYWASIFLNRYSSAVESTSAKDFTDLKQWFESDDQTPDYIDEFKATYKDIDLQRENQKGSAIFKAIFNILIKNGARDWENFERPEYDAMDDHHIVPQSWGKGVVGNDINSVLNRTPLTAETNRHVIRKDLPNVYLKRLFDNNDHEKVYEVLSTHLISREAVEILLRDPFEKEDYYEFLKVRSKTIIEAIGGLIVDGGERLPPNLQKLDQSIESIELSLRDLIAEQLDKEFSDPFKQCVSLRIQEGVERRIASDLRKNPILNENDFDSFASKLVFVDLMDLLEIMNNKAHWSLFEPTFRNKSELITRFNQLSGLRNPIRHSRPIDDVVMKDGETAILWFERVLGL